MSDIVERLRFNASAGIPDFTNSKLLDEAATEIERLREELESVKAQITIALKSNGFQLLGMAAPVGWGGHLPGKIEP